eukprot:CAMPEP_0197651546 /NCGR_PEP_ID=MMETSP1338-20131121/33051_1 /TAXON_ID=43686 ORGANISM="Pelagodinium beii, Strain RCC1491" /NCGR_SAMPLE_ID=MMETSP1338 /ASSEMBLY_ACC=CAM_ASM_000754 /LENGTH=197 /DNA_ID=CAMNT_0043226209 /DNA_START=50 /DNA_END=643 /DNA_ORIENTATION=+
MSMRLLILALAASLAHSSDELSVALDADELCVAGEDCALNAVQLAGRLTSVEEKEVLSAEMEEGTAAAAQEEEEGEAQAEEEAEAAAEEEAAVQETSMEKRDLLTARGHDSDEEEHFPGAYALYSTEKYGCKRTIPHSSCMVFHCKHTRGPTDCGITTGYYCRCGPGYCTDGYGCVPAVMGYRGGHTMYVEEASSED